MILFVSLESAMKQKTILKMQFGLGRLSGFLIYIFLSSSLVNVLSLSLIFIVQVQKCNCCNVSFTACLTSVIFQQYSNGFNEEFKYTKVAVNSLAR